MSVLTDVEKRKQYDLYGPDDERVTSRAHHHHREYEADSDEIFNMFFGSAFSGSNVYVRRDGRWQRQHTSHRETHHTTHSRGEVIFRFYKILF